ncbi:MAG: helix-turn-helix transcriptional regulator [Clostridia bacterium]|nr:helix-turn-helix transcriptional regulator [Clostridia bacterium]
MYVDYKEVGRRIAARRKALGLKQNKVNEMAELSDKYLSNIETARSIPSIDVLMRICKALNTTPDHILLGAVKKSSGSEIGKAIGEKVSSMSEKKQNIIIKMIDVIEGENI